MSKQPTALYLAQVLQSADEPVSDAAAAELRRLHEIEKQYHELLYAVGNKYEGEARHQTALRYVQQAEIVVPFAAKERNHD